MKEIMVTVIAKIDLADANRNSIKQLCRGIG
jgi:hypothetical protein